MDPTRISTVLAGVTYPAQTWQLLTHADHYGADAVTRRELGELPAGTYPSLGAVLATLRTLAIRTSRTPPPLQASRSTDRGWPAW
jgi:hypothetical protein